MLSRSNVTCRSVLAYCSAKYGARDGKGGIDKPSCEKDALGNIISIGSLKKVNRDVVFEINPTVSNKFKNLPFIQDLINSDMYTFSYFLSKSKQIKNYGNKENVPCVYFLRIDQTEWSGSELQKIEYYFYKINS